MNPFMKCCGYYCSCILFVSFFFFGIMIALVSSRNWWIIRDFPHETDEKIDALVIVVIVNAICFALCVGCTYVGVRKEGVEREEQERKIEA